METSSPRVTVLFIQPRGAGLQALATDVELRNLRDSLLRELHGDTLNWQVLPAARVQDLAWGLRYYQPAIIHFAGHGSRYGDLHLDADDDKTAQSLSAENLAETLRVYQAEAKRPVRLAVLAGCFTTEAASIAAQYVGCAIGMEHEIGDEALAAVFTPNLYAVLADGRSIKNAVDSAVAELRNHDCDEDAEMVCVFAADGVDPARVRLADLAPSLVENSQAHKPSLVENSQAHKKYLHALFKERWATVKMKLFDPKTAAVVDLLEIYSPLPVDFAITLDLDKQGKIKDWRCSRWEKEYDAKALSEPWERALVERADRSAMADAVVHTKVQLRNWMYLQVSESAMKPLVDIAHGWARQQETDRRRDAETMRWRAEAEHAALVQPRFVLVGDPGSGKSTFLRHLALSWAAQMLREAGENRASTGARLDVETKWPGRAFTPVYMELRPLVETFPALPSDEALPDLPDLMTFEAYLRDRLAVMKCELFFDDLISLLQAGRAVILLDGLDEVSDADDYRRRLQVQACVTALQKAFHQAPIIVTARPYAYRLDNPNDPDRWELAGFGYTTLIPLEPERQVEMAQRLFNCLRPGDGQSAREFVSALSSVPKDLPGNPLLLTLLAAVSVRRPQSEPHALPKTRSELYDRALKLLLEDWVREHNERFIAKDNIGLDSKDLRLALQLVARRAQERSTQPNQAVIIQRGDFYDALDDIGKGEATPKLVKHLQWTAGMLLDLVEQAPSAMSSPAPGRFRFLHLSFQEYLAACDMLYRPDTAYSRGRRVWDDRKFPDDMAAQVRQKPRLWANVLRLAVDELLAKGRVYDAWELLASCCQPYQQDGADGLGALLALQVALDARLFEVAQLWGTQMYYQTLHDTALRALQDYAADGQNGLSPEQRDIAGQLLGSGVFPGHDVRKGVSLRKDGLPDIDWVMVPKIDPQTGQGEWTYQNEKPKPLETFWIARYPITYAQFQTFLDAPDGFGVGRWWNELAAPAEDRANWGEQNFGHWNHPREHVSWFDAIAFCRWLTTKAKEYSDLLPRGLDSKQRWEITLPTEWQWEKAARGHDSRQYPWGDKYEEGRANIGETNRRASTHYLGKTTIGETNRRVSTHYLGKTNAVGMYPHNALDDSPYGVADLSGNVWEWCLNEYQSGKTDLGGNANRVLRGGSWRDQGYVAAFRVRSYPNARLDRVGFRVCAVIRQE